MPRLSDPLIRRLDPPTQRQQQIVYDDLVPGFGIRLTSNGAAAFVLNYTTRSGRERRFTIGQFGVWSTTAAREHAKGLRRRVDAGGDPVAEVDAVRAALTVNEVLDRYLESDAFAAKAPSSQGIDRGGINRHLRPLLGAKKADELTATDVERAFRAISAGETATDVPTGPRGLARVRGGSGAARKNIRLLRAILNWAVASGLAKTNGATGVNVGSDARRNTIIDAAAYRRVFEALAALEAEKKIRPATAAAICVIALTGARRGEIGGLRWRHVDLKSGVITLPPTEHKTGRRTGRPRTIGLPRAARVIIKRQPQGEPDDHVFLSAAGPKAAIHLSGPWRVVRERAKLPPGVGLHVLRHSIASHFAVTGGEAGQIMALLGHSQMTTASRYLHFEEDAHATLAERAARMITSAMKPKRRPHR